MKNLVSRSKLVVMFQLSAERIMEALNDAGITPEVVMNSQPYFEFTTACKAIVEAMKERRNPQPA
jgi:hypothetical protein